MINPRVVVEQGEATDRYVAELKAENAALTKLHGDGADDETIARVIQLQAENDALREALTEIRDKHPRRDYKNLLRQVEALRLVADRTLAP